MKSSFLRHRIFREGERSDVRMAKWKKLSPLKKAAVLLCALLLIFFLWLHSIMGAFRGVFWNLPSFAGFFGEKEYLVLLQNENELRPTGGFLTSFAIVKMQFGFPNIQFYNSEDVALPDSRIKAPEAIERVFSADEKYAGWVFRDSNFSLDFQENAERAVSFLHQDERFDDVEFDGIIAVDTAFLEDIIDVIGPLEHQGKSITGENFFETLEFSAKNFDHHDLEEWKSRKDSLAVLAVQVMEKLKAGIFSHGSALFRVFEKNAQEKHLLFSFSSNIQEKFRKNNWTGGIPESDFWTVNFANLGGRKGDRFLRKEFESSLTIDEEGKTEEQFQIRLSHEGTYNLQSDLYEAFVRIVRPKGTLLSESSGEFETDPVQKEMSHGAETSFFVSILPGEEKILNFLYNFPNEEDFSERKVHEFTVWKQPGEQSIPWNITFRGENDPRFQLSGCDVPRSRENIFFCDLILNSDRNISVRMLSDTTPPLLQFARFISNNEVELRFSEDISPEIPDNQVTFSSEEGEDIPIRSVTIDEEQIFLVLGESFSTPQEKFQVKMRDLKDISGNAFQGDAPGEFQITFRR